MNPLAVVVPARLPIDELCNGDGWMERGLNGILQAPLQGEGDTSISSEQNFRLHGEAFTGVG